MSIKNYFFTLELGSVKERFEKQPLDEKVAEKTVIDARCAELGGIKAVFESAGKKGATDEDLDNRKKEHLEQEFKRIQDEKKAMQENERRENEENLNVEVNLSMLYSNLQYPLNS